MAGENARVRTVAASLIDHHMRKRHDARVVRGAVSDAQLGCEGNDFSWFTSFFLTTAQTPMTKQQMMV